MTLHAAGLSCPGRGHVRLIFKAISRSLAQAGMCGGGMSLGSLSSDVTVTLALSTGAELLAWGRDLSLSSEVLLGIVMVLNVLLGALPALYIHFLEEARRRGWLSPEEKPSEDGTVTDFVQQLLDIALRVGTATSVQILALTVLSSDVSRATRVVSLLSSTVFFLFLSSASTRPRPKVA